MDSKIFIIWMLFVGYIYCQKISDIITPCQRLDPEINKCLEESLNKIFSHLSNNTQELNKLKLDPVSIPELDITLDAPPVKMILENVSLHGLSKLKVSELKFDFLITVPLLEVSANYKSDAILFNSPVKNQGQVKLNTTDMVCNATLIMTTVIKKNQRYLQITNLDLKLQLFDYNIELESPENNVLIQTVNTILNRQIRILNQLLPLIENQAPRVIINTFNKIFRKVRMDKLISVENA